MDGNVISDPEFFWPNGYLIGKESLMQPFYYLLSVNNSVVEVRKVESDDGLYQQLERLRRGEAPDSPTLKEYPKHVRLAAESLNQQESGWLVLPGESARLMLSQADQDFLQSFTVKVEPEATPTLYEQALEQTRAHLPGRKKNEPDLERIIALTIAEGVTRLLFYSTQESLHSPPPEPPELAEVEDPAGFSSPFQKLSFSLEIGVGLRDRFRGSWEQIRESVDSTMRSDYEEILDLTWRVASTKPRPLPFLPRSEDDEISLYVNGALRRGVRCSEAVGDQKSIQLIVMGLIVSELVEAFDPECAAVVLSAVQRSFPETCKTIAETGWNTPRLYRLFKSILRRGLPLHFLYLKDVFSRLSESPGELTEEEIDLVLERAQFHWNCMFGFSATRVSVMKLSEDALAEITKARGLQDLAELDGLRLQRWEHPELVLVPQDLCGSARRLFGRLALASEEAVPEHLEITVVRHIG